MNSKQFIGSEAESTYAEAKVVILPIPYERTTTYRKGCQDAPEAIITASNQLEAYDIELDREVCQDTGIFTTEAIASVVKINPKLTPETMIDLVCQRVSELINDGKFVIALGGEHSITAGVVKAYQEQLSQPFTVIQIDAHGDMRHSYEGSIYNHACVMRRVLDMQLPTLLGIRSICLEEAKLIKDRNISVVWAKDIYRDSDWSEKAIALITTEKVFITIDLDGLDPSLIPGVETPEPGGLNWYELTEFLQAVFSKHQVIGCDVMELAPTSDSVVSEFTAAKLVYKLIGYSTLD